MSKPKKNKAMAHPNRLLVLTTRDWLSKEDGERLGLHAGEDIPGDENFGLAAWVWSGDGWLKSPSQTRDRSE